MKERRGNNGDQKLHRDATPAQAPCGACAKASGATARGAGITVTKSRLSVLTGSGG
jgi:hypothetical protein